MLETILTLFSISFVARMSPGPDMMLLIRHATAGNQSTHENSSRAAYFCVLGICLGLCGHVSLSVLGLAVIIKTTPVIFNTLRYAGALYLLYIGFRSFTATGNLQMGQNSQTSATTAVEGFRDGLLCNILNPKVTIFVLSVFMQLVEPDASLFEKALYGSVILIEGLVGWTIFVYFLHTPFMRKLYGQYVGIINKACGIILFLLGGAIFVLG